MTIQLPKVVSRRAKRLGQGRGSGKGGHTVGRGQKGQKARGKVGILFEGTKIKKSLLRRLPVMRGKGKFRSRNKNKLVVKLSALELLPEGANVDIETLAKAGIVDRAAAYELGVKVLGRGELKKKLNIEVPISKSAAEQVKKAGGTVSLRNK